MKRINKQTLITAFMKTVVTLGLIHYGILFLSALKTQSLNPVNFFRVLGVDVFYPAWGVGFVNFIVSYLFFLGVYVFFLVLSRGNR